MKVLYFHQHFSTPSGSVGTRSYEFAKRLIARGHEVTMVCGRYAMADTGLVGTAAGGIRRGNVDGIQVIEIVLEYSNYDSLPKRSMTALRFAWASIRIAFKEPYDLLFATSTPLTASLPGIVMRLLRPGKKFVFEVRDLWPELPKAMGVVKNPLVLFSLAVLERASYFAMHAGVGLSPGIRDGMRQRSPSATPIELIPNGCDLETFGRGGQESMAAELPAGYAKNGLRCIFCGAHGLANGLNAVLDAARRLQEQGRSDIQIVFVGDGKLKPQLMERCRREQLENCLFLDPLPKHQLADLLEHADVGLMVLANVPAFYYGTSPNKFFDYAAAGLAIVNNYPGWLAELIEQHSCGCALPPDDAPAFAAALTRLADDPAALRQMSANSRTLAEDQFDRSLLSNRFVDFLEKVAGLAKGPAIDAGLSADVPVDSPRESADCQAADTAERANP